MPKLEFSTALGRNLRKDNWDEIGIPTLTLLTEAIEAGRNDDAISLAEYLWTEGHDVHEVLVDWVASTLDYVAETQGEDAVEDALRFSMKYLLRVSKQKRGRGRFSPIEWIQYQIEALRAHRSGPGASGTVEVTEEPDRFVVKSDPCGGCQMLRRRDENGEHARTDPEVGLRTSSRPHPWMWGKTGRPFYCAHSAVWQELMSIEGRGYPARITECPDDPSDPCTWYYYKDPADIPPGWIRRTGFDPVTRERIEAPIAPGGEV